MVFLRISASFVAGLLLAPAAWAQQEPRPQVPVSLALWLQLKDNPESLNRLGAALPSVAAEPGLAPAPPLKVTDIERKGLSTFSLELAPTAAWTNLANVPPGGPYNFGNPILLTDGSVIVHCTDTRDWYKLTPANTGSFASVQSGYGPKFFAAAVPPDGRVIVEGGEYNLGGAASWGTQGSIYDPIAGASGSWTPVASPSGWQTIGDAQSTVLANGKFMLASCCDIPAKSALLNPAKLTWNATGTKKADRYDEESLSLLPDESVHTVDTYTTQVLGVPCGLNTEKYNPASGAWSTAGNVPAQLSDCNNQNTEGGSNPSFEIGPQVMMYNCKAIAFGGTTANVAHTALYDVAKKGWTAGPDLPMTCGASGNLTCTLADAPATLLPNGDVLYVASAGKFRTPAKFFIYDSSNNLHKPTAGTPDAGNITSFYVNFLALPTGQILAVETYTSTIQIYTPEGTFQADWQPKVIDYPRCVVPGRSYMVEGKQLNGLSQSANYGDDQQAATNYPLVRIVNNATGHVSYARTYGHSTMTIAPNAPGSTNFAVAGSTEFGPSKLYVAANGIPSAGSDILVTSGSCPGVVAATSPRENGGRKGKN